MDEPLEERHFQRWRSETAEHNESMCDFLSWFDSSHTIQENDCQGYWDFSFHILKPEAVLCLGEPFNKTALEIGYGAGRLLAPACHFFAKAIGIDIHEFRDKVAQRLRARGIRNFELHQTDGTSICLNDMSVDFVYSFIVLQHLPTIGALARYLREIHRVMKPKAVAVLYMGYLPGLFRKRYVDLSTKPIDTASKVSLRLTKSLARELFLKNGFRLRKMARSRKKPWLSYYGHQFYVITTKQELS